MPRGVYKRTKKAKKNISKAAKKNPNRYWLGKKFPEEHKRKLSEKKKEFYTNGGEVWNKDLTKETDERVEALINKTKETRKGTYKPNKGSFKKGQIAWNKGVSVPEERKEKQSKVMKGRPSSNKGKTASKETRKKQSKARLKLIVENGGINPTFKHIKRGYFYSHKNQKEIHYASSYELQAYQLLEQLDIVAKYGRCEFYIEYEFQDRIKRYIPDILVEDILGNKKVIEIKPLRMVKNKINQCKFNSAKIYCRRNDMEFEVWTEKDLFHDKENKNSKFPKP